MREEMGEPKKLMHTASGKARKGNGTSKGTQNMVNEFLKLHPLKESNNETSADASSESELRQKTKSETIMKLSMLASGDVAYNIGLDSEIDAIFAGLSNEEVNDILFTWWAEKYDEHMEITGHTPAIRKLLGWITALDRDVGYWQNERLIGERVMELSCGTGTILDILLDNDPDRTGILVGNDINAEMRHRAVEKLGRKLSRLRNEGVDFLQIGDDDDYTGVLIPENGGLEIGFTNLSIPWIGVPAKEDLYDTVILSQTIHLLTDSMKEDAIRKAVELLKPGGTLIILDEFPALLSSGRRPVGKDYMLKCAFDRTFHPIYEKHHLREVLAGREEELSFVMELKECIIPKKKTESGPQSKHSMYAFVFRKKGRHMEMPRIRHGWDRNVALNDIIETFDKIAPRVHPSSSIVEWGLHTERTKEKLKEKLIGDFKGLRENAVMLVTDEFVRGGYPPTRNSMNPYPIDRVRFREIIMRDIYDELYTLRFRAETAIPMDMLGNRAYGFLYEKVKRAA